MKATEFQATKKGAPIRVFIVEDELASEAVLTRIVRAIEPRSRIDWVEGAEQATIRLQELADRGESYDLIIADIFLQGDATGLDLWALCQHRFPHTPLLVTSSLPVDRFLELVGRDEITPPFLAKPIAVGEGRQIVEGLLNYRRAA